MNSLSRYFLAPSEWSSEVLHLTAEEAHHCARVLRAKEGDEVEVFDGEGQSARCVIEEVSKSVVRLRQVEQKIQPRPDAKIELCQAIPKGSNMEWIIQKAVELGVDSIQPLVTHHTVARAEQMEKKQLKWQRVALEACKQCGQNSIPEILPTKTLKQWLEQRAKVEFELVAALDPRSNAIQQVVRGQMAQGGNTRLLIGPEGDFSADEYEALNQQGMVFASIGEIVLKVETATLFCLSVLSYERGCR